MLFGIRLSFAVKIPTTKHMNTTEVAESGEPNVLKRNGNYTHVYNSQKEGLMKLVLYGAPRTKKNSGIITTRGKHPRMMPSAAYSAWDRMAQLQLAKWRAAMRVNVSCEVPVNVKALFYREALVGDAVGFYQALADTLEKGGIVENDRLIVSWDGSRLLKDANNPRVEVEITEA